MLTCPPAVEINILRNILQCRCNSPITPADNIPLAVDADDFTVFRGPRSSDKATPLPCSTGLHQPDSGESKNVGHIHLSRVLNPTEYVPTDNVETAARLDEISQLVTR